MNIEDIFLHLNEETRFENFPTDLKVIILSQVLLKPNIVTQINELCKKNNIICQNIDLYKTLWLKYVSKKLPKNNISFDEFKQKYEKITNFYIYANTTFIIKDINGKYPDLYMSEYVENKDKYDELTPILKNKVDYNIQTLAKYYNNIDKKENDNKNCEIVYYNTINIISLINNIKNKKDIDKKILDKVIYVDQLIDDKTLLMHIANYSDPKIIAPIRNLHKINKYISDVDLLVKKGADLNIKNNMGMTALMYAVKNDSDVVKMLINLGANVNAQDND